MTAAYLVVLGFLILSYRETIKAYPSAGGAYMVKLPSDQTSDVEAATATLHARDALLEQQAGDLLIPTGDGRGEDIEVEHVAQRDVRLLRVDRQRALVVLQRAIDVALAAQGVDIGLWDALPQSNGQPLDVDLLIAEPGRGGRHAESFPR